MEKSFLFSLIIPLFNEADNIAILHMEILQALPKEDIFEIIYVNDGSTDNTYEKLIQTVRNNNSPVKIKLINIIKNVGQSLAIKTGIDHSSHENLIFLDGDLQNDPKDIPSMILKYKEGFDIIQGYRVKRKDDFFTKIFPSLIANFILRLVCGSRFRDLGCSLKILNKRNLEEIVFYHGMHRVLAIYYSMKKMRIAELAVTHRKRIHGKSKYGLSRVFEIIFEVVKLNFFEKESNGFLFLTCFVGLMLILSALLLAVCPVNTILKSNSYLTVFITFITGLYSLIISSALYILRSSHIYNKKQQSLKYGVYVQNF